MPSISDSSSSEDHCSSRAVLNDAVRDEDRGEGFFCEAAFNEAGGVLSGVGGLRWSMGALVGDGLDNVAETPLI